MDTLVEIAQGTCRGVELEGVVSFLGIPYAAAPFGALRMRPPVPHKGWSGVRDCVEYGPTVPKAPYPAPFDRLLPEPSIAGEECLNLNIWAPKGADGSASVLIWIHGGAFANGSGSAGIYSGQNFARDGVVTVTINYRLAAEGFLYLGDESSNLGIQDQLLAIRWVRENISRFGGDPDRVTIAGESAGAMSVGTLLSLPQSRGLFRGAIMQSGAASHWLTAATALKVSTYLAESLGIPADRAAFLGVDVDSLTAASSALAAEPQASPDPVKWGEITRNSMIFEPVVDGSFIAEPPLDAIRKGAGSDVTVLIGTNAQEFNLFTVSAGIYDVIDENFLALAALMYGLDEAGLGVYGSTFAGQPPGEVMGRFATDWFFRIPAIRLAEARAGGPSPTYMYDFKWGSPLFDGKLGACHAVEIPFVFDNLGADMVGDLLGESPPSDLASEVHQSWVAFVKNLDPGWSAYSPTDRLVRTFAGDVEVESDPDGATRGLWDGVR